MLGWKEFYMKLSPGSKACSGVVWEGQGGAEHPREPCMRDSTCPGSASLGQWAGTVVTIAIIIAVLALCTALHAMPGPLLRCDSLHVPFQGLFLLTSQDSSGRFLSLSPCQEG